MLAKKDLDRKNKGRRIPKLKIGDLVFRKTHHPGKVIDIWKGPFEIIELINNGNTVTIDEGSRISKQNIKNIHLFKEERGCRTH